MVCCTMLAMAASSSMSLSASASSCSVLPRLLCTSFRLAITSPRIGNTLFSAVMKAPLISSSVRCGVLHLVLSLNLLLHCYMVFRYFKSLLCQTFGPYICPHSPQYIFPEKIVPPVACPFFLLSISSCTRS